MIILFLFSYRDFSIDKSYYSVCILDTDITIQGSHGNIVNNIIKDNGITVFSFKVLDRFNSGDNNDLLKGLNFCEQKNAKIINMSLSSNNLDRRLKEKIEMLIKNKKIVVTSIPNDSNRKNEISNIRGVISIKAGNSFKKLSNQNIYTIPSPNINGIRSNSYATARFTHLLSKKIIVIEERFE